MRQEYDTVIEPRGDLAITPPALEDPAISHGHCALSVPFPIRPMPLLELITINTFSLQ